MKLLKPLIACSQEIYVPGMWTGVIFDAQRRSRRERLSAIESEGNNNGRLDDFPRQDRAGDGAKARGVTSIAEKINKLRRWRERHSR
jgi:hypothetical protein